MVIITIGTIIIIINKVVIIVTDVVVVVVVPLMGPRLQMQWLLQLKMLTMMMERWLWIRCHHRRRCGCC